MPNNGAAARVEEVVAEALREWQRNLGSPLAPTTLWIDRAEVPAKVVLDALRALPVEQRMEAMGMALYGTTDWDDEEARDVIEPDVDVTPGAPVWVERTWVSDVD